MSRIYLKKRTKNSYWIKDILDGKKLGKVKVKNKKNSYKIKRKYKNKFIEYEVKTILNANKNTNNEYKKFICEYNKNIFTTENYSLPIFTESCRLKKCSNDMFNRPLLLHPAAKKAWRKMQQAASLEDVDLQVISAFRSLDYQKQLIENKLSKGMSIEEILKVNTLPGYSEHHTGCAIDIGSKGCAILETEFDQSEAFKWLRLNAYKFGFYMTYPKNNTTGICYEPWHWCFNRIKKISPNLNT